MKKENRFLIGAAAAMLLFVGGGCAAEERGQVEVKAPTGVSGDIDATVDAIIESGDDEAMEQKKVDDEAGEVSSDSTELNAYSESSYEVK